MFMAMVRKKYDNEQNGIGYMKGYIVYCLKEASMRGPGVVKLKIKNLQRNGRCWVITEEKFENFWNENKRKYMGIKEIKIEAKRKMKKGRKMRY